MLARPIPGAVSQTLEAIGDERFALSQGEQESWTVATAATLYYYGGELHPLWLLGLCIAATAMPRTAIILKDRREKKKAEEETRKLAAGGPRLAPGGLEAPHKASP